MTSVRSGSYVQIVRPRRRRPFATKMLLPTALVLLSPRLPSPRVPVSQMQVGGTPQFVLMWYTPQPIVYETLYGGAEQCALGRHTVRLSTKLQAITLGKKLVKACDRVTYSVYKLDGVDMRLLGSYPKGVNFEGARIKFRRRQPKTGGADDGTLLGVGGMGDDVWRELMERDGFGSLDEAWSKFRKELELGRGLEIVDENGDKIDIGGDYADDEDPEYD